MPRCYINGHHDRPDETNRAFVEGIVFPVLVAEYRVSKDAGRHRCPVSAEHCGPAQGSLVRWGFRGVS
jgi:hypothetical protein